MNIPKLMQDRIAALSEQVTAIQKNSKRRYPKSLRMQIIEVVRVLRSEQGLTWQQCSQLVSVSHASLFTWCKSDVQEVTTRKMLPVVLKSDGNTQESHALTLTTPAGHSLSGFSLREAASLLRMLS